jgi:hypothetical protein
MIFHIRNYLLGCPDVSLASMTFMGTMIVQAMESFQLKYGMNDVSSSCLIWLPRVSCWPPGQHSAFFFTWSWHSCSNSYSRWSFCPCPCSSSHSCSCSSSTSYSLQCFLCVHFRSRFLVLAFMNIATSQFLRWSCLRFSSVTDELSFISEIQGVPPQV